MEQIFFDFMEQIDFDYIEGTFASESMLLSDFFKESESYKSSGLTSIDLFAGCGGLSLGLRKAGIVSILASDIDANCQQTFNANFPDVPFLTKDISLITREEVDHILNGRRPDIIVGGPPCQGFSLANKRRNNSNTDPRNKLFYEFVKFINWYEPTVFIMENVKGLLSMKNGEVIKTIVNEFSNAGAGYNVRVKILKANNYGVPQTRERVIIIGYKKQLNKIPLFPAPIDCNITTDMAIGDLPPIEAGQGETLQSYLQEPFNEYQCLMRLHSSCISNHIAMRHI